MDRIRLSLIALATALVLVAPAAPAASPDLVISQIYGGGEWRRQLCERLRRALQSQLLQGRSHRLVGPVRRRPSTTWTATPLAGTLAAGQHYLVQFASAGTAGSALPTPDATDTTNLSASRREDRARARSRRADVRRGGRQLLGRRRRSATCSATAARPTTSPRSRQSLSSTTAATRAAEGLHGHRCERVRLHGGDARAAQLLGGRDGVQRRRQRRRRRARSRRRPVSRPDRPVQHLAHARTRVGQLRDARRRRPAGRGQRARHGLEQRHRGLCAERAPDGVHAGRPAARHQRICARDRRSSGAPFAGGALVGAADAPSRSAARHHSGARARPAATCGRRASRSPRRCPPSHRASTPRRVVYTVIGGTIADVIAARRSRLRSAVLGGAVSPPRVALSGRAGSCRAAGGRDGDRPGRRRHPAPGSSAAHLMSPGFRLDARGRPAIGGKPGRGRVAEGRTGELHRRPARQPRSSSARVGPRTRAPGDHTAIVLLTARAYRPRRGVTVAMRIGLVVTVGVRGHRRPAGRRSSPRACDARTADARSIAVTVANRGNVIESSAGHALPVDAQRGAASGARAPAHRTPRSCCRGHARS